jgi:hypothetical protein
LRIEGKISVTDPYGRILGFLDRISKTNTNKIQSIYTRHKNVKPVLGHPVEQISDDVFPWFAPTEGL